MLLFFFVNMTTKFMVRIFFQISWYVILDFSFVIKKIVQVIELLEKHSKIWFLLLLLLALVLNLQTFFKF